jgi:predicted nucleic acid-binding protein
VATWLAAGADTELGRRQAQQLELAVIGVAGALVAYPAD